MRCWLLFPLAGLAVAGVIAVAAWEFMPQAMPGFTVAHSPFSEPYLRAAARRPGVERSDLIWDHLDEKPLLPAQSEYYLAHRDRRLRHAIAEYILSSWQLHVSLEWLPPGDPAITTVVHAVATDSDSRARFDACLWLAAAEETRCADVVIALARAWNSEPERLTSLSGCLAGLSPPRLDLLIDMIGCGGSARDAAVRTLLRCQEDRASALLMSLILTQPDWANGIIIELGHRQYLPALSALAACLTRDDASALEAALALASWPSEVAAATVTATFQAAAGRERVYPLIALGGMGAIDETLAREALASREPEVRAQALLAIGRCGLRALSSEVATGLDDPHADLRGAACSAIRRLGGAAFASRLQTLLDGEADPRVSAAALLALDAIDLDAGLSAARDARREALVAVHGAALDSPWDDW